MKILNTLQIREVDQYTIENEPIKSIDLMERASKACFEQIKKRFGKKNRIMVFCGMGNNGGDGLAISRMLITSGFDVSVFKIVHSDKSSADFRINEERLKKLRRVKYTEIRSKTDIPDISSSDCVVDAIFGSGLTHPLEGLPAEVVKHINASGARVIAIDLPSGLFGENNTGNIKEHIIRADYTFTFQFPKLAFMFPENDDFAGEWQVLDIGLDQNYINRQETPWHFMEREDLAPFFRKRRKFDHKGLFGHALLIAGSKGKSGAAVLAARAALKSGAGLVTTYVPACNYDIQQMSIPESMVMVDDDSECFSGVQDISRYSAVGIGPGIGTKPKTQNGLKLLIQNNARPMVFDADALNILAENPTWLSFIPPGSILTPHVGEIERLVGKWSTGWERLEKARELAFRFKCFVVLKGAHTSVSCPNKQVIFNSTGNPALAKGGSGDVLTGIILGLLAQGYSPQYSAMAGVYLHGLAADLAVRKNPVESILAGDIIEQIGQAIKITF